MSDALDPRDRKFSCAGKWFLASPPFCPEAYRQLTTTMMITVSPKNSNSSGVKPTRIVAFGLNQSLAQHGLLLGGGRWRRQGRNSGSRRAEPQVQRTLRTIAPRLAICGYFMTNSRQHELDVKLRCTKFVLEVEKHALPRLRVEPGRSQLQSTSKNPNLKSKILQCLKVSYCRNSTWTSDQAN